MAFLRVALAICSLAVLASPFARPAQAGGCQTEIEQLCKSERPIVTCLRKNEEKLSDECRAYLAFFERMPACLDDARRLCPTDKPSGAGMIACLRGRQSDLSEECRKEIGNIR